MLFKAAVAAFISLAVFTAGLYWQNSRVTAKNVQLEAQLEAAEIRAENAIADAKLIGVAIMALSAHTARVEAIAAELARNEDHVNRMEGSNDPIDPNTLDFIKHLGLLDF